MTRKKILAVAAVLFAIHTIFAQTADDAYALFKTGNDYFNAKDYDSAITYYTKAVPMYEKVYGTNHLYTADVYFFLGLSYSRARNYQVAIPWLEKSLAVYDSPQGDKESAAGALREIANTYFRIEKYDDSLNYYQRYISSFDKTTSQNILYLADAYYHAGFCYSKKDDYNSSIASYKKALEIYEAHCDENDSSIADTYNDLAMIYDDIADYDTAIQYYEKALKIYKILFDENNSSSIALVYSNLGVSYLHVGDYQNAMLYAKKALYIQEQIFEHNSSAIAQSYNNLGLIYYYLGNHLESLHYYEEALAIKEKLYGEIHLSTSQTLNNIGLVYCEKGDYSRALSYYLRVEVVRKQLLGDMHSLLANTYANIGLVYDLLKNYELALEYHKKALKIFQAVFGENHEATASSYNNIAIIYEEQNLLEDALNYFEKALKTKINCYGEMTPYVASAYGNLGLIYARLNDYEAALNYRGKELSILEATLGENHYKVATCLYNIGMDFYAIYNYDFAVKYWRLAFEIYKQSSNFAEIISSLDTILIDSKKFPDKIPFIRDTIALACDTVERARLDMSSIKSDILQKSLPVYYYGVDFEARNGNPAKAFEYAEMLRSRGFLDEVGLGRALALDGVTDGERKQIKELTSKIAAARKEIENQSNLEIKDRDAKRLTQAEKDLAAAEKSLAKLDGAIGKRIPAYAQLRNPQTVRIKDAQKWCGNDKAILEYVLWNPEVLERTDLQGEPIALDSYCLVITNKSVTAIPLDGEYDFDAAVTKLRDGVIPKSALAKPTPEVVFEGIRNELYEKLIEPAMPHIKGKRQLLIVPDGNLAFLPFDILRKDEDAKMLCQQFALALSPSVSVSMIADSTRNKGLEMLAFGAAWYDESMSAAEHRRTFESQDMTRGKMRGFVNPAELVSAADVARYSDSPADYFGQKNLRWKDLPGTLAELAVLKEKAVGKKRYDEYVQENASESNVKRLSHDGTLAQYPILHFACHGYFDKDFSDMSSILFSEVSGRLSDTSSEDGYLTIPEVATLNLDADMVCLSACETGLGKMKSGDGMTGLTRAFMVAGSRHVGATLWSVDDAATAEFMASMYRKIEKKGMTYEQAYRQTKAEFINSDDYAHPYYWAAFVLYE